MRNVLITGGTGFLGTNLVEYIASLHEEVRITVIGTFNSPLSQTRKKYLEQKYPGRFDFRNVDIIEQQQVEDVFAEIKPDLVIHLAAVGHQENNAEWMKQVNVEGTRNLVSAAKKYRTSRFYYQSTGLVYGQFDKLTFVHEDTPLHPKDPYALSKALAETSVQQSGLPHWVIGRICNIYGPWQNDTDLLARAMSASLSNEPFSIHGDGSQTRQFLYIGDAVRAIWTAATLGEHGKIYNIAPEGYLSIREAVTHLFPEQHLVYTRNASTGGSAAVMDPSHLQSLLPGWPYYTFEQGIKLTRDWYAQHAREGREFNLGHRERL